MSLHFVFGASGAGKSYYIYQKIIRESIRTGAVYDADTEGTGPDASKKRNFKY